MLLLYLQLDLDSDVTFAREIITQMHENGDIWQNFESHPTSIPSSLCRDDLCFNTTKPFPVDTLRPSNSDVLLHKPECERMAFLEQCFGQYVLQTADVIDNRDDGMLVYKSSRMKIKELDPNHYMLVPTIKRLLSLNKENREYIKQPITLTFDQLRKNFRRQGKIVDMGRDGCLTLFEMDMKRDEDEVSGSRQIDVTTLQKDQLKEEKEDGSSHKQKRKVKIRHPCGMFTTMIFLK